jgi:hypothetical protein
MQFEAPHERTRDLIITVSTPGGTSLKQATCPLEDVEHVSLAAEKRAPASQWTDYLLFPEPLCSRPLFPQDVLISLPLFPEPCLPNLLFSRSCLSQACVSHCCILHAAFISRPLFPSLVSRTCISQPFVSRASGAVGQSCSAAGVEPSSPSEQAESQARPQPVSNALVPGSPSPSLGESQARPQLKARLALT